MNEQLLMAAIRQEQAGNRAEAAKLYAAVLNANPRNFKALYQLANLHFGAGGYETAERLFEEASKIDPKSADVHFARGCALQRLKRNEAAVAAYDKALVLAPGDVEVWSNRAVALQELKRHGEALASIDRAIALQPHRVNAWFNRGTVLLEMKRYRDAIASFDRALAVDSGHLESIVSRGNALAGERRYEEALAEFGKALAVNPSRADALGNRAAVLFELRRYAEAVTDAEKLVALDPDRPYAKGLLLRSRLHCCDWRAIDEQKAAISAGIAAGKRVTQPFALLSISDSPEEQRRCAEIHAAQEFPAAPPVWRGERYRHQKIRLAYLSADFSAHATAHLMAGVFEHHDKSRFETMALSFGRDDGSEMRARLKRAFGSFVEVAGKSDAEAAAILKANEIDIAVDLKGYTQDSRPGILSYRPAPVQVAYLGYPGTMGAPYIDYILADRIVIPPESERFYSERVVSLPDSYQCNDAKRSRPGHTPSRAEAGLPERGFVFCSFNNVYKIMPEMFSVWMGLLRAVEGGVLWLLDDNETATRNLRGEAERRGVKGDRLHFAPKLAPEEHLARHRLAGLFLDTLPYGAHTTASDALWMGLPLVTCLGSSFAARVPASLLHAVGLPELVTRSLPEYEALALKLARDPAALATLKAKLEGNRMTAPLFDTARFTRGLEAAYVTMWETASRGETPKSFAAPGSAR
jgi:predicted O-linked N-acetylglucosamine transferase (SPINDLY family)